MRALRFTFAVLLGLLWAGSGQAVPQFTPSAGDRLHTLGSGQPGAQWTTGGSGSGGQLSYAKSTGLLTMTATLDVLNYFDPVDLGEGCSTDAGSNCSFNYGPDLDITLTAQFSGLTTQNLGGGLVAVTAHFMTTGGVDLLVTDPFDGGSTMLEASWQAGTFLGNPTTGLSTTVVYDTVGGTVVGGPPVNEVGFLAVDPGTLYASLFQPTYFGINFGSIDDFDDGVGGDLDDIVAASLLSGTLESFDAEANGQVLNLPAGQFVPEPGTSLLLGGALLAGAAGRRGRG